MLSHISMQMNTASGNNIDVLVCGRPPRTGKVAIVFDSRLKETIVSLISDDAMQAMRREVPYIPGSTLMVLCVRMTMDAGACVDQDQCIQRTHSHADT